MVDGNKRGGKRSGLEEMRRGDVSKEEGKG